MRNIVLIALVGLSLVLVGCANGPQERSPTEYNTEYMAAVERHARNAGVEVRWVNPPRRARVVDDEEEG